MRQNFLYAAVELGFLGPGRDAQQDVGGPGVHEGLEPLDALASDWPANLRRAARRLAGTRS